MVAETQNDQFLTEKEFAERFGLAEATVRSWRVLGKGPKFLKIGRIVRYRLSDVLNWEETLVCSSTSQAEAVHA
ncbi:helix-turn-helix transcriptional regulator [Terasakiella pusilla]|uniref:helix-turn-helix transcriptional regulator n=1 Tax=Terasakiella pusilla TaxID=64973 RepID=UPI003AA95197